jgi:hypothetical protein
MDADRDTPQKSVDGDVKTEEVPEDSHSEQVCRAINVVVV